MGWRGYLYMHAIAGRGCGTVRGRIYSPPPRYGSLANLLDNYDYKIAQAGYGGMHGNNRYAADR